MTTEVVINNCARDNWTPIIGDMCDTFFSRFLGLMFVRAIDMNEGKVFVNRKVSAVDSSIHMLFMRFDIAVVWLSQEMLVIDKTIALKWRPYYAPKAPAAYILEIHPNRFNDFAIGEMIKLQYV